MTQPTTPNRLRPLLSETGKSAAAVADHLGIGEVQVNRWAQNKVLIPTKHVEALAAFLDTDPATLMGWASTKAAA